MINRIYLVLEGLSEGYPNKNSARLSFTESDPAEYYTDNLFTCSPIFTLDSKGVSNLPSLEQGLVISFFMVPKPFPVFEKVRKRFRTSINDNFWYSLGLANLILIESIDGNSISKDLQEFLNEINSLTAVERWEVKIDGRIVPSKPEIMVNHDHVQHIKLGLSKFLPADLQFLVSEYIITVDKILTASKKFTPHYYQLQKQIFNASNLLIKDISFLHKDFDFIPSDSLIEILCEKLRIKLVKDYLLLIPQLQERLDEIRKKEVEELINEKWHKLIHFSSAITYVYSQCYSGTFPILDHVGIVRRHALLGLGTSIGALFELIIQMDYAFNFIPFENIHFDTSDISYKKQILHNSFFLDSLWPDDHRVQRWSSDGVKNMLKELKTEDINSLITDGSDFYCRLSFYSGRLGFREYDFSATSALQVLVGANSPKWHIINYTHEIIHNHVRSILNKLLIPYGSKRKLKEWVKQKILKLNSIRVRIGQLPNNGELDRKFYNDISYYEYFQLLLLSYCVNSKAYGSLSREWDLKSKREVEKHLTNQPTGLDPVKRMFGTPTEDEFIRDLTDHHYRDLSEIFVHVIDFKYIYDGNLNLYVNALWASWITVPVVRLKIKQYILRTLLLFGITVEEELDPVTRFDRSVKKFQKLFSGLAEDHINKKVFDEIDEYFTLDKYQQDYRDLEQRFSNCIVIADIVAHYFIANVDPVLFNSDRKIYRETDNYKDSKGNALLYEIDTMAFEDTEISSKTRFLLDQFNRMLNSVKEDSNKDVLTTSDEYVSSWLLLALSSTNLKAN
ncbi:MAG: hypothetical protein AAF149_20525 [Bacteroidota bacterium]